MWRKYVESAMNNRRSALVVILVGAIAGCGGDARVELAAADALERVAAEMAVTVAEYHAEVEAYDDSREAAVLGAFVARIRRDAADEAKCDSHGQEFTAAMAKLRADRRTEGTRLANALTHVDGVREAAGGLRRIGIAGLSLQDEMRRYLLSWVETRKKAQDAGSGAQHAGGLRIPATRAASSLLKCADGDCAK